MPIDFNNPTVKNIIRRVARNNWREYTSFLRGMSELGVDSDAALKTANSIVLDNLENSLRNEGIINSEAIREYQDAITKIYERNIENLRMNRFRPDPARQAAAQQLRQDNPARQRQVMPAIQERPRINPETVRVPQVEAPPPAPPPPPQLRLGVQDLPQELQDLAAEAERANKRFDEQEYTTRRTEQVDGRPNRRMEQQLRDMEAQKNTAQTNLRRAIDQLPEAEKTRITEGLTNNKILRVGGAIGKALPVLAGVSEVVNIGADLAESGKLKEYYEGAKEAVQSPVKTIQDFSKEAADFVHIMKGKGKSNKAIRKKIEKDIEEQGQKGLKTLDSILMPLLPFFPATIEALNKKEGYIT